MSYYVCFKDALDIVLVPIVLTGLALWLPRRWQNKQKELELKSGLVSEISEAVMTTVMSVYLYNTLGGQLQKNNVGAEDQRHELDKTYKKWKVDSCIIGSKIHAYFPVEEKGDEQIHIKWTDFSDRLSEYFKKYREIQEENNECTLEKDKERILHLKAKIIQEILVSQITGFR